MSPLPQPSPKSASSFPRGPRGLPLLGNFLAFQRDTLTFLLEAYRSHGELVRLDFPGKPRVAVFGAEQVNEMLVAPEATIDKTTLGGFVSLGLSRSINGAGIISTTGTEHQRHRQILLRAFGNQYLEGYQGLTREVTAATLAAWKPGTEVELVQEITRMGKRIALRILFGLEEGPEVSAFVEALDEVTATLDSGLRVFTATLIPWDVPALSNGGTVRRKLRVIDGWMRKLLEDTSGGRSMGHTLLRLGATGKPGEEQPTGWGVEQVRDNLIQLYMTGYDTTTCALTWTLYLLAQHPEACATLLAELQGRLEGREPRMEDFNHLPYLDAVVKESLRLYPTGPYGFRETREAITLGGYHLPARTVLLYSPWVTHRIPTLFPEPETFRPERFGVGKSYPKGAYIPFGQGSRSCVAAALATLQIKTVVAMLLQRFRVDLLPGQRIRATSLNAIHLVPGLRVRLAEQDGRTECSPAPIYGNVVGARGP